MTDTYPKAVPGEIVELHEQGHLVRKIRQDPEWSARVMVQFAKDSAIADRARLAARTATDNASRWAMVDPKRDLVTQVDTFPDERQGELRYPTREAGEASMRANRHLPED
jgi:hypothetical protein